jgi:hypothetical protein
VRRFIRSILSILIFIIFFFVVFGFVFVSNTQAATLITLSNGQVECDNPAERPYCIPEQELFSEMSINIVDNGEVSGQATKTVNFEHAGRREGTSESYNGTASINIQGSYDYYSRTIKGKFDFKTNLLYIVHRGDGDDSGPLNKTSSLSEQPFKGKTEGDNLKIDFNKTFNVTYTGVPRGSDVGKLDEDMNNWAITSGAKEKEENDKVYTGKINAELGGDAGISDLYGQGEINMPQPGGAYDEEDWRFAKLDGKKLPVGTHIKTFDKSGVMVTFGQMTINLGPDSELIIAPVPDQPGLVKLLWGNMKANVKKMMKDGSMEVEMSQAVAGIKGTTFILEETKNTSTIKVIEGSVAFKSKLDGKTEMVKTGEKLIADKNGIGKKMTFDSATEEKLWAKLAKNFKKSDGSKNLLNILIGIVITFILIGFIYRFRTRKVKP